MGAKEFWAELCGVLFTAWGIGGIRHDTHLKYAGRETGSYIGSFVVAGVLLAIGAVGLP